MLAVYTAGPIDAPLVVLCHGVTDSSVALADLIERLSKTYRVAAVDSLGHGYSPRLTEQQAADPFEACIDELIETVEHLVSIYGSAVAIGHSMGGALVTALAERRPDLVRGIIAEDPAYVTPEAAAFFKEVFAVEARRQSFAVVPEEVADGIRGNIAGSPTWPESERLPWLHSKYCVDNAVIAGGIVGFVEPWKDLLPRLTVPTVVVTADGEGVVVGGEGAALIDEAANPLVTVEVLPGLGHCVRRDDADAFHAIVDPIIAQWTGLPAPTN